MSSLKIAFIPIARTTFDIPYAQEKTEAAREALQSHVDMVGPSDLVTDLDAIEATIEDLEQEPVDLAVVFQATFADSSMVAAVAHSLDAPLFLWAVPEEHTGGRLRLNSFCGINLAGHALTREGIRYQFAFAPPHDSNTIDSILSYARAGRVRRLLRSARLGRVGQNPNGFETCLFDANELARRFGVEVVQYDLRKDIFSKAKAVDKEKTNQVANLLAQKAEGLDQLDQEAVHGSLSTYLTLQEISRQENLNGFAVRCWPEFFTELGCAACGAMSMLSDEMIPCSCEADVHGTITQMMLQWLSDEPAFLTDMVSVDQDRDAMVLWHCGLAPLSMADPDAEKRFTIHSNRELPLLMEFPLKPGRVTAARLTRASGELQLVLGSGTMLKSEKIFSGTSGLLQFDRPTAKVIDTILEKGLEHHIAITYGDYLDELRWLAAMLDLPVITLV
jgi:L-fucose isomerase-like protein